MANTYLERIIEAGSVGRTFTYSVWFKRTKTGASTQLWNLSSDDDSSKYIEICIKSDDKLDMQFRNGTSGDNGTYIRRITTRLFRDTNAFYNVILRFDSTQSSADDRFRLYINGEQETSFSTSTGTIPQNYVTDLANSGGEHRIGRGAGSSSVYWDGSMSHFHFVDGQSYAPTVFGSQDATTNEWKINPSPSISTSNYGTNGFFILKDGNSVTDQSGNSHNFTVAGGTLTKTEDCPSNVFATISRTVKSYQGSLNLSNGNNTYTAGNSWNYQPSTIGVNSGKYYWEQKFVNINSNGGFGLVSQQFTTSNLENISTGYSQTTGVIMYWHDGTRFLNGNNASFGSAIADGDIMGCALDLDSGTKTITFYKNNTSQGTINLPTNMQSDFVFPCYMGSASSNPFIVNTNFGNGYFGTTAVTSNSGNGYSGTGNLGIFQYQPPTNYTALSTKGLNL